MEISGAPNISIVLVHMSNKLTPIIDTPNKSDMLIHIRDTLPYIT